MVADWLYPFDSALLGTTVVVTYFDVTFYFDLSLDVMVRTLVAAVPNRAEIWYWVLSL